MILIDTSSWVHQLRARGDAAARNRVEDLLRRGLACWCAQVRLELWNGAGGEREHTVLREYERVLPELPITESVWTLAMEMACKLRVAGVTVPAGDILIAACARHHRAGLESCDTDFEHIRRVFAT